MEDKKGKIPFNEMIRALLEKLKGIHDWNILLLILFVGILLMIFNFSRNTDGTINQEKSEEKEVIYNHQKALYEIDNSYEGFDFIDPHNKEQSII